MMTYDGSEDSSEELRRLDPSYSDHVYEYRDYRKMNNGPRLQLDFEFPRNKANAPRSAKDDVFLESAVDLPSLDFFEDVYAARTWNKSEKDTPDDMPLGSAEHAFKPKTFDAQKGVNEPVQKDPDDRALAVDRFYDVDSSHPLEVRKGPDSDLGKTKQEYDEAMKKYDEAMRTFNEAMQKYNEAKRQYDKFVCEMQQNNNQYCGAAPIQE